MHALIGTVGIVGAFELGAASRAGVVGVLAALAYVTWTAHRSTGIGLALVARPTTDP